MMDTLELCFLCTCLGLLTLFPTIEAYKLHNFPLADETGEVAFEPYEDGYVGYYGDPGNHVRYRINEGGQLREAGISGSFHPGVKFDFRNQTLNFLSGESRTLQVIRFDEEEILTMQDCPGMVGPLVDGSYYCTDESRGYCDRRSGTCWCYKGYSGKDCSQCETAYFEEIGTKVCKPKIACAKDCSGAGTCDYSTGECTCMPHRTGTDCSVSICSKTDQWCTACDRNNACVECIQGYFLNSMNVCTPCVVHDPRCVECNSETCISCADPLLLSIRRSGRRKQDSTLPFDETNRELSQTFEFGSQSINFFDDSETYEAPVEGMLNASSVSCIQGIDDTFEPKWTCRPYQQSHVQCGHIGTISFSSPTYAVLENEGHIMLTVRRTGGGFGRSSVSYSLVHETTDNSDVSATTAFTSSQVLTFMPGVVQLSFRLTIHDDSILELDETFQVHLHDTNVQYSSSTVSVLGDQSIARITILDDDYWTTSAKESKLLFAPLHQTNIAGEFMYIQIQPRTPTGRNQSRDNAKTYTLMHSGQHEHTFTFPPPFNESERVLVELDHKENFDIDQTACYFLGDSDTFECRIMPTRMTKSSIRVFLAKSGGLTGNYFANAQLAGVPDLSRVDAKLNFTWGIGRIFHYVTDFASIRWEGALEFPVNVNIGDLVEFYIAADDHCRMYINERLIVDHWDTPHGGENGTAKGSYVVESQNIVRLKIEYREISGSAHLQLKWKVSPDSTSTVILPKYLYQLNEFGFSPIENILVRDSDIDAAKSFASGEVLHTTTAGDRSTFHIHPRDRFGNRHTEDEYLTKTEEILNTFETTVEMLFPDDSSKYFDPSNVVQSIQGVIEYDRETGSFQSTFVPHTAGEYQLSVRLLSSNAHIEGSPFLVTVKHAEAHGPTSDAFGRALSESPMQVGEFYYFNITVRDEFGNVLTEDNGKGVDIIDIRLYHRNMSEVFYGEIENNGQGGEYMVKYKVTKAGVYDLHVTLNCKDHMKSSLVSKCEHLSASPYEVSFHHGPTRGNTSFAVGMGIEAATSGVVANFDVYARDKFSNAVDDYSLGLSNGFTVLLHEKDGGKVNGNCVHAELSRYACSYVPQTKGESYLDIQSIPAGDEANATRISGGLLYRVLVGDGSRSVNHSFAYGIGTKHAIAGESTQILIQSRDAAGNNRTNTDKNQSYYALFQLNEIDIITYDFSAVYLNAGLHEVIYNIPIAGNYNLTIVSLNPLTGLNESLDLSTDLEVYVEPTVVDFEKSMIFNTGIVSGATGDDLPVYIQAVDRFGNNRTHEQSIDDFRLIVSSSFSSSSIQFLPEYVGNGLYDVTYQVEDVMGVPVPSSDVLSISEFDNIQILVAQSGGLDAEYFNNPNLEFGSDRPPYKLIDPKINFSWVMENDSSSRDSLPHIDINSYEHWSVRWKGIIKMVKMQDGIYSNNERFNMLKITVLVQGGEIRVWMDGKLFLDTWDVNEIDSSKHTFIATGDFSPGTLHAIQVEYSRITAYSQNLNAHISFRWEQVDVFPEQEIPAAAYHRWRNVSSSPYFPVISPSVTVPSVSNMSMEDFATSGHESVFYVQAKDAFGNNQWHCNDDVVVYGWHLENHLQASYDEHELTELGSVGEIRGIVSPANASCEMTGLYKVRYTPHISGINQIFVAINPEPIHADFGRTPLIEKLMDERVNMSPFLVDVEPDRNSGKTSLAYGEGLYFAIAGEENSFIVNARDPQNNTRSRSSNDISMVSILSKEDNSTKVGTSITYLGSGLYNISYTAFTSGNYHVNIYLDTDIVEDSILNGSPFTLFVKHAEANATTTSAIYESEMTVDNEIASKIYVVARDSFGNIINRGGDSFVFHLRIRDVFTAQNLIDMNISESTETSISFLEELDVYKYGAKWIDYIHDVVDYNNGTYEFDFFPIPGTFELDIELAHGTATPNTPSCLQWEGEMAMCSSSNGVVGLELNPSKQPNEDEYGGLLGKYYSNPFFEGKPDILRVDNIISMNWNESLFEDILPRATTGYTGHFKERASVRWDGFVKPEHTAEYTFKVLTNVEASVEFRIGGNIVIEYSSCCSGKLFLRKDILYPLMLEMKDVSVGDSIELQWGVDLGADSDKSTPDLLIPGTVSAQQYSSEVVTSSDWSSFLRRGDEVRIGTEEFTVEHYDFVLQRIYLDSPYQGLSSENMTIYTRRNMTVIPTNRLFHGSSDINKSPFIFTAK